MVHCGSLGARPTSAAPTTRGFRGHLGRNRTYYRRCSSGHSDNSRSQVGIPFYSQHWHFVELMLWPYIREEFRIMPIYNEEDRALSMNKST